MCLNYVSFVVSSFRCGTAKYSERQRKKKRELEEGSEGSHSAVWFDSKHTRRQTENSEVEPYEINGEKIQSEFSSEVIFKSEKKKERTRELHCGRIAERGIHPVGHPLKSYSFTWAVAHFIYPPLEHSHILNTLINLSNSPRNGTRRTG